MYVQGRDHCSKSPQRKRKWKDKKGKEVFYSHMNHRNASYVQGAKC